MTGSRLYIVKWSAGVAPEVNLRNPSHKGEEAHKAKFHPEFDIWDRRHQKSKTGVK